MSFGSSVRRAVRRLTGIDDRPCPHCGRTTGPGRIVDGRWTCRDHAADIYHRDTLP